MLTLLKVSHHRDHASFVALSSPLTALPCRPIPIQQSKLDPPRSSERERRRSSSHRRRSPKCTRRSRFVQSHLPIPLLSPPAHHFCFSSASLQAITDGHDLIRAWSLVLKPHPASLAGRSPAGKKKKSRLGGGLYGGASVGGARKLGMKKLRGVGAGAKGGGGGSGVV